MTPTPRTEAQRFDPVHHCEQGGSGYGQMKRSADGDYVPVELARELEHEIAELRAHAERVNNANDLLSLEATSLNADKARLDWLADPKNTIGNVTLPRQHIMDHPDSMRAAIDAAMEGDK
jgi:hypothetical protein